MHLPLVLLAGVLIASVISPGIASAQEREEHGRARLHELSPAAASRRFARSR
jgi:hypothetical protein